MDKPALLEYRRQKVKQAYNWPNWHEKVDKMSDGQVFAIFTKLIEQGKIK